MNPRSIFSNAPILASCNFTWGGGSLPYVSKLQRREQSQESSFVSYHKVNTSVHPHPHRETEPLPLRPFPVRPPSSQRVPTVLALTPWTTFDCFHLLYTLHLVFPPT